MKTSDTSCIEDYLPPIVLRVPSLEEAEKELVGLYLNNFQKYGIIPPTPQELDKDFVVGKFIR